MQITNSIPFSPLVRFHRVGYREADISAFFGLCKPPVTELKRADVSLALNSSYLLEGGVVFVSGFVFFSK